MDMTTGEIILNIALAMGFSAFIAGVSTVVPNYDRIRFFQRFGSVQVTNRRERADRAVGLRFAE